MFKKYFQEILENSERLNCNYIGIDKKENPKWEGWKIIASHKEKGTLVNNINDEHLKQLVENFYRLKYLEEQD
jgi:hypothetical protein